MKRSAGLQRHKPLLGSLDTHRAWKQRSQDNARRKAEETPARPKDTGPSRKVRDLIRTKRAEFRCEVSGAWLGDKGGHVHHRRPRRAGGSRRPDTNTPPNLLLIHPDVHDWIENNRTEAHRLGLLLHDKQIPALEEVRLRYAPIPVVLNDLGGWTATDTHEHKGERSVITNSIWWDDSQYLVEDLPGDFAATKVSPDGSGLYTSFTEGEQVASGIEAACDADERRRAA